MYKIFVTSDLIYIMGKVEDVKEPDTIETPLILSLLEDNVVQFLTYDIFNKNKKIKIENYITCYEPADELIKEYERIIEEPKKINATKEFNDKNVTSIFNFKKEDE